MKVKKLLQMLCLTIFLISSSVLYAQQTPLGITLKDVIPWGITIFLFIISVFLTIFLVKRRKKAELEAEMKFKEQEKYIKNLTEELKQKKLAELEAQKEFDRKEQSSAARTAEDVYRAALKEELGRIDLLGSPEIESKTVKLEDAFVSLCISEAWQSEKRFETREEMEEFYDLHLSPEQVMTRAFKKHRLLLVIGDPGSGKTTLMKYYAVSCLNKKYREFGFKEDVFPIYFPLRELDFKKDNNEPALLPQNLEKWAEKHLLNISSQQFHDWLHKRKTLVLLDGLDEISSKEQRQKVCRWVKDMYAGLKNACFVVTSRSTGYRKLDGIELEVPHLRADIMDFSLKQQEVFLKKWFRAVYCAELPPVDSKIKEEQWKEKQEELANRKYGTIIEFLNRKDNKAVQELAAVPMLLQIMAIIWKERDFLPKTRTALYDAALNYLLEYRDQQRDIKPVLPAKEARRVLTPTALWMQEKLKKDEAPKQKMHDYMQPILDTLESRTKAAVFCENLSDRAGLIAEYKDHYIFRHKSFREFLSALQMVKDSHQLERIQALVEYFKEDWWEEALRFFMSESDDKIFDRFMDLFFNSTVSQELNANEQTLLQNLVKEAPQKRIDALVECLNSKSLNNNQKRYVMDCLKTIGTPEAFEGIEKADNTKLDESNLSYAQDIIAEASTKQKIIEEKPVKIDLVSERPSFFRNPFEDNVEYIKIPGGTYKYSVTEKMVTVPDLYFCKYPVTNKRYRRFISYLEGKEIELVKKLPTEIYSEKLLKLSESLEEYKKYLGNDPGKWRELLRSRYDDDKKFKGDDQPVVGVTWYAARAYCFWLSCLETVINKGGKIEDVKQVAGIYRLPTEEEWEWAAGGEPDGAIREYPCPKDKGEPNPKLANYNRNVGATTPVGRYPEGATPEGLMDMAGNVWEWMENLYQEDKPWRAVRGGSWASDGSALRCSARINDYPLFRLSLRGFRVLRSQS
jgi:formylglycine-generating enzyme required for sulfatase activity/energy-coupling factor transporter ATP-binding protein EcfA2